MFNIIKRNRKRDHKSLISELNRNDKILLHGEFEIIGTEKGKVVYYDKGDNTITVWAKHSTMHVLTGESFSSYGSSRLTGATDHVDLGDTYKNSDGTLVSGRQYFAAPTFPGTDGWWSRPASGDSLTHLYPFFPTKMLFGTGIEFRSWATGYSDIGDSSYLEYFANSGWDSSTFDTNISNSSNVYSAYYDVGTGALLKTRTMNDITGDAISTPALTETSFAVKGAIKNALYENNVGDSEKIELVDGDYFAKKQYAGIGKPAFIYARRSSRFYQTGSEISLNWDSNVENKITYTVTLPEQTGVNAGTFYPYNGYLLKEVGLFADARFVLKNTNPANVAASDNADLDEFDNYTKMPYGLMFSKRRIAPVTKSHSVTITGRWTIYL
jgi:hypothetical protein